MISFSDNNDVHTNLHGLVEAGHSSPPSQSTSKSKTGVSVCRERLTVPLGVSLARIRSIRTVAQSQQDSRRCLSHQWSHRGDLPRFDRVVISYAELVTSVGEAGLAQGDRVRSSVELSRPLDFHEWGFPFCILIERSSLT